MKQWLQNKVSVVCGQLFYTHSERGMTAKKEKDISFAKRSLFKGFFPFLLQGVVDFLPRRVWEKVSILPSASFSQFQLGENLLILCEVLFGWNLSLLLCFVSHRNHKLGSFLDMAKNETFSIKLTPDKWSCGVKMHQSIFFACHDWPQLCVFCQLSWGHLRLNGQHFRKRDSIQWPPLRLRNGNIATDLINCQMSTFESMPSLRRFTLLSQEIFLVLELWNLIKNNLSFQLCSTLPNVRFLMAALCTVGSWVDVNVN